MNENLKDRDILLVREKGSNELKVANTGKDGKVKQTSPDSENPDLLKIDRHGNILENFFENFMRQVKNPTRFEFFRVPAEKFKEVVRKLQNAFKNPEKPENKAFIDLHRINPEDFLKKQGQIQPQAQTQTPENSYAINPDSIHWDKLEKFGITRESLEKTGNLAKMLDYRKTDLMPVSIKIDDETTLRTDARFSLRRQQDGTFVPAVHPIRHKPDLERPYFGVTFSEEDKKNLLTNGNLGRVVDAEFRPGEKTSILLSLDKLTNELVAFRADRLNVPEKIKGVELSEQQRKELSEGKAVHIDNMTSKNGKEFSASIQFNADKRSFEFLFDNDRKQNHRQENEQRDVQKTFRGKELTENQRDSLREGKTVHVDGLVDKKVKDNRIADVAMTGSWENALAQIERGDMQPETFGKAIEVYTRQITAELLETKIAIADENTCLCPKCKTAYVRFYSKVAKCTEANCDLVVFRNISDKQLSDGQITELLTKGKTAVIKGFKSKAGKAFNAALKFDGNYRVTYDFSDKIAGKGKK